MLARPAWLTRLRSAKMAAIGEVLSAILAFIFEMLVWSLVAFWKLCLAVFSKRSRAQVAERWRRGTPERLAIVGGVVLWLPVFAIGFGLGLPLVYGLIKKPSRTKGPQDRSLAGEAAIIIPHRNDPDKEFIVRIDRSRISEIRDTKDLPELAEKLRELGVVVERKKPNQASESTSTAVTPPADAGDRASGARGSP